MLNQNVSSSMVLITVKQIGAKNKFSQQLHVISLVFLCAPSFQYFHHSNCGNTLTNVTFYSHSLSHKHTHTSNTLLLTEACCVLSGGTQMAATWSVLVGSCDSFGQDMNTHTDGDPQRVNGRRTCSLLICSDQWFTTWSSNTREVAPAELAHWPCAFGTPNCLRRVP